MARTSMLPFALALLVCFVQLSRAQSNEPTSSPNRPGPVDTRQALDFYRRASLRERGRASYLEEAFASKKPVDVYGAFPPSGLLRPPSPSVQRNAAGEGADAALARETVQTHEQALKYHGYAKWERKAAHTNELRHARKYAEVDGAIVADDNKLRRWRLQRLRTSVIQSHVASAKILGADMNRDLNAKQKGALVAAAQLRAKHTSEIARLLHQRVQGRSMSPLELVRMPTRSGLRRGPA